VLKQRGIALRLAIAGTALLLVFAARLVRSRGTDAREREQDGASAPMAAPLPHVAHARDAGHAPHDAGVIAAPVEAPHDDTAPTDRLGAVREQIHLLDLQRLDAEQRGDATAVERIERERARLSTEHDALLAGPQGI
jgi:hypothetical protein